MRNRVFIVTCRHSNQLSATQAFSIKMIMRRFISCTTRTMKRLYLFSAAVFCSLTTLAADFTVDGISYNISSTDILTVEVTSSSPKYSGDVVIPATVTYNGNSYSVTSIRSYAFASCTGLTSITIPNSVTSIGDRAFYDCSRLTSVIVYSQTPPDIAYETFSNSAKVTLYVPQGSKAAYQRSWSWYRFKEIVEVFITFADANVENICIQNWDTDGDDAISFSEAKAVTDLGAVFQGNTDITSFNELQYFTGLTTIDGDAFSGCTGLTSVTPPNTVTSIGNNAFYECTGLTSVTIPNTVTSIGNNAFYECSGLTSINIPNTVTSIGNGAFYNCNGLSEITIPNTVTSIENGVFYGCSGLTSIIIPNSVTSIGDQAFSGCTSLNSVSIPNTVTSIGDNAFSGCSSLTSIIIPSSVTSIGSQAFNDCSGLTSVRVIMQDPLPISAETFSNRANATLYVSKGCKAAYEAANYWKEFKMIVEVEVITFADANVKTLCLQNWDTDGDGELAFSEAAAVTDLGWTFEEQNITSFNELQYFAGLITIGDYAFYGCTGLTEITIPNSVTSIGDEAFNGCSGLTEVTIPNSVTSIGNDTFSSCSGLTEVTIPNSVTSIGCGAFNGCSGLTEVTIPNSVTNIEHYAFNGCSGLTSVTIPNSVTTIREGTFSGCSSLTEVTIPNSVTNIEHYAFEGCRGLTSVTIPNSVTSIGWGAFSDCSSLTSIAIPNTVTSIEGAFSGCSSLTEVTIPNSVTSIGDDTFSSCSNLTSVTIPNSVASIGWVAFSGCSSLTEITIPNSVTSIGGNAFSGCSSLTEITIPNSVTTIGRGAFSGCSGLAEIKVEEGNPVYDSRDNCNAIITTADNELIRGCQNTVIPNSVTSIGYDAFSGCIGLTEITIPNSVTSIGGNAFSGCTGLTSVKVGKDILPISSETFSNRTNATLYVPRGSKAAYEAAPYWGEFKSIIEYDLDGASIRISSAGVATYCSDTDLDFTHVKGLKAYVATGYNTRTHNITMMRVYAVPAGTGLYLKGNEGTYDVPYGSSYVYLVNLLKGTTAPITLTQAEGNMTNFILSNGESGVGFYPLSQDGPFGANKAYLQVPSEESQGAKMIGLEFEENSTNDINEVTSDQNDNDNYYTLSGVKVEHPTKGIYIHKGKKVVVE